jgi:hypothetical protein
VGAAGELFSVRRNLYQDVPADTVLDDFMISMLIAAKGYRIIYEPEAYALGNRIRKCIRRIKTQDPHSGGWHPIYPAFTGPACCRLNSRCCHFNM